MDSKRFSYSSGEELVNDAKQFGGVLPWNTNTSVLFESWKLGDKSVGNRFVIHPMEGFDSKPDGSPGELSLRRYKRYAEGGSGLIWIEALNVSADGRSNPLQMFMNKSNFKEFSRIPEIMNSYGNVAGRSNEKPLSVIQLTHSGKYSNPTKPAALFTDDELKRIRDEHVEAAIWSERVGFDAVDIKICHGYLTHELLSSTERKNSIYGGRALENRIRLVSEIVEGIEQTCRIIKTIRLNVFDGFKGGFGGENNNPLISNLNEANEIVQNPLFKNIELWSITAGVPYVNPWVTRPFDKPAKNSAESPENPLLGALRMIELSKEMKKKTDKPIVGSGLSWFRQFYPMVSAGIIHDQLADAVGFGRMAFAYPDMPKDIYSQSKIDKKKVCVTCSGCTNRMREGLPTGCIIRDREFYAKN